MSSRYTSFTSFTNLIPRFKVRPAAAMRDVLAEGYTRKMFAVDALAGVIVGVVALPLAMALAINSGVAPQQGIYTAIVAGGLIAVLGGSRNNVSGPTAAFIVILAPIASTYGLGGLMVATVMAGAMLVAMGMARLGRMLQYIPHPVTTGFTSGIAVVIATTQVDKLLGLDGKFNDHWIPRVKELVLAAPNTHWQDLLVGVLSLAVLIYFPRATKRVPAPVVALTLAALVGLLLSHFGYDVATLNSKFSWTVGLESGRGIPPFAPHFEWPWNQAGGDGKPLGLSFELIRALGPAALAIAMLGAIESLLCAVVADGMAGTKHDPDAELIAQGVGNLVAPFFGGIAATGAIARTATAIRSGAKTPVAGIVHALFVLMGVLVLAPALGYLPMAAMAALLLLVAWNMAEVRHFSHILKVAPRSDVTVLLVVFGLTVVTDMVVSVSAGVMLAALLFMRRMAEVAEASLAEGEATPHASLPKDVIYYEIRGPLFFGAAEKAISALASVDTKGGTFLIVMDDVPAMDVTGLVALESAIERVQKTGGFVVLCGVRPQPMSVFKKAGLSEKKDKLAIYAKVDDGVAFVRQRAGMSAVSGDQLEPVKGSSAPA